MELLLPIASGLEKSRKVLLEQIPGLRNVIGLGIIYESALLSITGVRFIYQNIGLRI